MITRFAPSPTGPLHLGHAYSAILAHDMARAAGGRFLLRIDDLDQSRARPEWEAQILDDLAWLGLSWDGPVRRQSDHFGQYRKALDVLGQRGLLYPCSCKRRDILAAISAPQEGAMHSGPDGLVYPGSCRGRTYEQRGENDALRLDLRRACAGDLPDFIETGPAHEGRHVLDAHDLQHMIGDPVLARPHMAASYHFSVVLDDAATHVSHVIRGEDLFEASYIHRLLQWLMGLPAPIYHHHRLIRDETGKRLAKRDDAQAISSFRQDGASPRDIRAMVGIYAPSN